MVSTKGKNRRFYTPYEVAQHNTPSDCWVSFLGGVYDLTNLLQVRALCETRVSARCTDAVFEQNNPGVIIEPLIKFAGQDISGWCETLGFPCNMLLTAASQVRREVTRLESAHLPCDTSQAVLCSNGKLRCVLQHNTCMHMRMRLSSWLFFMAREGYLTSRRWSPAATGTLAMESLGGRTRSTW